MVTAVVFDVGETLIDETRMWQQVAKDAGVPAFTLMGTLGGLITRAANTTSAYGSCLHRYRRGDPHTRSRPLVARTQRSGVRRNRSMCRTRAGCWAGRSAHPARPVGASSGNAGRVRSQSAVSASFLRRSTERAISSLPRAGRPRGAYDPPSHSRPDGGRAPTALP